MLQMVEGQNVPFQALFSIVQAGYACIGHVLFGSTIKSFYSVWSSLLAISALLTSNSDLDFSDRQGPRHQLSSNVFLFFFCVFTLGFLTCYVSILCILRSLSTINQKNFLYPPQTVLMGYIGVCLSVSPSVFSILLSALDVSNYRTKFVKK